MKRVLGILDSHLKTQTFLVGERITLADITVVCTLLWLYKQVRGALLSEAPWQWQEGLVLGCSFAESSCCSGGCSWSPVYRVGL